MDELADRISEVGLDLWQCAQAGDVEGFEFCMAKLLVLCNQAVLARLEAQNGG